ncbi:dolichol kinase-like [Pecten maximus]|uniref:dolichol kinase-like n=1 Tax=Pecten maximus TaxID=6579 RepID=UPI001458B0BA|nr:dolichol kinase-like [Pecten maximus]XP_033750308.1 dolichol kinase-like [Pecten maximus]
MEARAILETGVVTAGCISLGTYLQDKANEEFQLHSLGFLGCSYILVLLHQLVPQFNPELKRTDASRRLYRTKADPGIWCCAILPLAYVGYSIQVGSLSVLETSFLLFTIPLTLVHYNASNLTQIAGALQLLWLRSHLLQQDVFSLGLFGVICVVFFMLLTKVPELLPRSFTEGEITVVLQLLLTVILSLTLSVLKGDVDIQDDLSPGQKLAVVAFEGVLLGAIKYWIARQLTTGRATPLFYLAFSTTTLTVVLPLLYQAFGSTFPVDILEFILQNTTRTRLLILWTILIALSGLIVYARNASIAGGQVSSDQRKVFHLVMMAVYVPGLLMDPAFLWTSSVIALGVMVILEVMRMDRIWPLGSILKKNYRVFVDSQDQGEIILTPLYLLLGLFWPLWIVPMDKLESSDLRLYAGVISLGVGDTMASVGGSCMGRHRWPGSKKTIEGTCFAVISQLVALYGLHKLGVAVMFWQSIQAVFLTSLLEALTSQIDNLVLPLYMFCLLSIFPT